MKIKDSIARADELRPNQISDKVKSQWVQDLDGQLAEYMGVVRPVPIEWPSDDTPDLLMPSPYDEIYQLYLCCRIDYELQEMEQYANDSEIYTQALQAARAWWRRNHRSTCDGNWKVL